MYLNDYKMGLRPDDYDDRDYKYCNKIEVKQLPKESILPISSAENQDLLGSCTSFSLMGILQEYYANEFNLSKLFQYYNSLVEDGVLEDNGTSLRNAMRTYNKYGCCLTEFFPYDISKFKQAPNEICYEDGKKRQKIEYYRVTSLQEFKESLAEKNYVYCGIKIYDSFYQTGKDGIIQPLKGNFNGLHAIQSFGYNDDEQMLYCRNSWSEDWGDNGCFKIPYSMFNDIFVDIWSVSLTDKLIDGIYE